MNALFDLSSWWLPAILIIGAMFGAYANRSYFKGAADEIETRRKVESRLFHDRRRPTAPIQRTEKLDGDQISDALSQLAKHARDWKPDWIIGVHVGGRLLSVAVAEIIKLRRERCVFVSTHLTRNRMFAIDTEGGRAPEKIEGKILVIDDISRTGRTLQALQNYIYLSPYVQSDADRQIRVKDLQIAVLVVAERTKTRTPFYPDWAYFRTTDKELAVPWGKLSENTKNAYDRRDSGAAKPGDEDLIKDHEMLSQNFELALNKAREYLPVDEVAATLAPEQNPAK